MPTEASRDEAEDTIQVCFRSARGNRCIASVPCSPHGLVPTKTLFASAKQHCASWIPPHFHLVFRGAKLDPSLGDHPVDLSRLGTVFIAEAHRPLPLAAEEVAAEDLFSSEPTPLHESNQIDADADADREPTSTPTTDAGPPPTCRICFGTESAQSGRYRLFRPCRCAGSLQYVHMGCLNEWRRSSANTDSYLRCSTCQYSYNTQYTELAKRLERLATDEACLALSGLALAITVGICAAVVKEMQVEHVVLHLTHFQSMYYRQVPYGKELCVGLFVVGLLGFAFRAAKTAMWLYRMRDVVTIDFVMNNRDVQAFATIFLSYGNIVALRTAVSIGVVYFVYTVVLEIKAKVKYIIQEFGEIILEVQPSDVATPGAS